MRRSRGCGGILPSPIDCRHNFDPISNRKARQRSPAGILKPVWCPSDVIAVVVFWSLRCKFGRRGLRQMLLLRGFETSHESVRHRKSKWLDNRIERDHRGFKSRQVPMQGFRNISSAARFCRRRAEVRDLLRPRDRHWIAATRRR
jgi:transposase-like protein